MTTVQPSATSTADDVLAGINLKGRRVLVTGVSAGIGVETARVLAAQGAQVVGTARDLKKARAATDAVWSEAPGATALDLVPLDLASLDSVRKCAAELIAQGRPFDLVIANAGIMGCGKGLTADGYETHFATNHLGHFLLVNRIASLLKPGARVVSLTSWGHNFADVDLDDPNFERTEYDDMVAYGRSKTANALFAVEFDRRHRENGIRAVAVHPGGIATELYRHTEPAVLAQLTGEADPGSTEKPALWKSTAQGAATSVWAGVVADAEAVGGRYCEDCHVAGFSETGMVGEEMGGVRRYALDPERARALWELSERMVGETC